MRYFGQVAYNGTGYVGWQNQPNGKSVQSLVEDALAKIFRKKTPVTGCGRTDTSVHASCYFLHFNVEGEIDCSKALRQLNGILPPDILFQKLVRVQDDAHARFDATQRTYRYYITGAEDPFRRDTVFFYREMSKCDFSLVQEAAGLIAASDSFFPFTKSDSDTRHYQCDVRQAAWHQLHPQAWYFEITANRFLRGMVRMIVGACLYAGTGKMSLGEIKSAIVNKERLQRPWSVPGHGLYLTGVEYPFLSSVEKSNFLEPFGPVSQ